MKHAKIVKILKNFTQIQVLFSKSHNGSLVFSKVSLKKQLIVV